MPLSAYAVILDTRADRDLTGKQPETAWIEAEAARSSLAYSAATRSSLAYSAATRYLRFTIHVDAETVPGAVTEALRVTGRAARAAGFGCQAEELRVLPSARLEEETVRLLSA